MDKKKEKMTPERRYELACLILGGVVLGESVTAYKAAGVAVILLGLVLLSAPEKKEDRPC